jgi:hypothetical protein
MVGLGFYLHTTNGINFLFCDLCLMNMCETMSFRHFLSQTPIRSNVDI